MSQTRAVVRMIPALLLALAVAVHAAVLPTEAGDMFYFSFGGVAGAVDAFGRVLWSVPGQLIASDPMGSCLAVASAAYNRSASPPRTGLCCACPSPTRPSSCPARSCSTACCTR